MNRVDDLSKVLDHAKITTAPTSSDAALVVSDGADGKITIKGSLEAGKTVTVSYKMMVKPDGQRGDNLLGNFLVNPGETPPTTCEPGNPDCTTNPVPYLVDKKSVDPASGTAVKAGQELTYTLTFKNKGAGAGEINRVDNLTGVLDDATISAKPSSSDGALTVTDGSNGKINITGTIDASKTVTVTYKVTVKPDGQRGDNLLGNFLLNPGETPPTTCVPGSDKCTNNPVTPTPVTPVVPADPSLPDTGVQGLLPILYGAGRVFLLALFSWRILFELSQYVRRAEHFGSKTISFVRVICLPWLGNEARYECKGRINEFDARQVGGAVHRGLSRTGPDPQAVT